MANLISANALAAPKKPQGIPPCVAYLTADDVLKTPGPLRAEIAALRDKYVDLDIGVTWGKDAWMLPLKMGGKDYQTNAQSLPTVPKLNEGEHFSFLIGLRGRLKHSGIDYDNRLTDSVKLDIASHRNTTFYALSSTVNDGDHEDHLILYLSALNVVPYANLYVLNYFVSAGHERGEFLRIKARLDEGEEAKDFALEIAPPAVRLFRKSKLVDAMSLEFEKYKDDQNVDTYFYSFLFFMKPRPALN